MMWAGWPDHPGACCLCNGVSHMTESRRPARVIAIAAAQESRKRLLAIGVNCAIAAILAASLAIALF